MNRVYSFALIMAALGVTGCAKRIPLPKHLQQETAQDFLVRVRHQQSDLKSFTAEIRLTYFQERKRLRGTALLATSRPCSLRYEVVGPHGGVLEAFAMTCQRMQLLDTKNHRFIIAPTSIENIDRLLPFAPLHLQASAWVAVLFGEIDIPQTSQVSYDEQRGVYVVTWQRHKVQDAQVVPDVRVEIDPVTAQIQRMILSRDKHVLSDITIEGRDKRGLPEGLRIRVPGEKIDFAMKLRQVDYDPEFADSDFVLQAPQGISPEVLE
ncbi:MAG: hypothetical protein R3C68_12060 [Myxococcota bacterium]